jgi:hypothetical protein
VSARERASTTPCFPTTTMSIGTSEIVSPLGYTAW